MTGFLPRSHPRAHVRRLLRPPPLGKRASRTAACVLVAMLVAIFFTSKAYAEEPKAPTNKQNVITDAKGKKITVVDFDDASIEGRAKAPDGFVLRSRAAGSFKNIIELRRNFRPQIQGSAYEGLVANPSSP